MRLLAFVLAVISTIASFGITTADSVKVYFRAGHRQFDPSLDENGKEMDSFINKIRQLSPTDEIDCITVRAYASPDGTSKANELLAQSRCNVISDYIVEHSGVNRDLIKKFPEGIAWDGLRELVEQTPEVPSREAVLDILVNTPIWVFDSKGKVIDGRKSRLMWLDRGIPYRWMQKHLFPELRNAVAITLVKKGSELSERSELSEKSELSERSELSEKSELSKKSELSERSEKSEESELLETSGKAEITSEEPSYKRYHFALKTNLLYDAALMPNLELEWLIKKHWSIGIEGDVAWWKFSFDRIYRLAMISPEARYYIRPRAPWHGMYVGLFAGGGLYQLENRHDGYKGEGGMGGLSFGYVFPLGKHFSFEAGIGAGYMHTRYKVYKSLDGHKLYMSTKSLNYFGPLKLKLSIAWRFDIKKKIKKINSTL